MAGTIAFLKRWARWASSALLVILVVLVCVAPLLAAPLFTDKERCLLIGGFVVQIAGFVTVWRQIHGALLEHGRPGFLQRIRAYWNARPRKRIVLAVGMAEERSFAGGGIGRVSAGPGDGSVGARLDAIERNIGHLGEEIDVLRAKTSKDMRDLQGRLDVKANQWAELGRELSRKIENQAVGSADLQLVGLLWFVSGSFFSTFATCLAGYL